MGSGSWPIWIVDWWQSWVCLGIGAFAGTVYLFLTRQDRTPAADVAAEVADAERRKDLLVEELRELAEEKHKVDPTRYQAERERLESAAADALRARDTALQRAKSPPKREAPSSARAAAAKPPSDVPGWFEKHPQAKGAAWGGGVVLFFVLIWRLVTGAEAPRVDGATMTGIDPGASSRAQNQASTPAAPDSRDEGLSALVQAVQKDPNDTAALNQLAHQLIFRDDFTNASDFTERVLRIDPIDVEARAHRAVLKSAQGDDQAALDELNRLGKRYPNAAEIFLFDGLTAQRAKQDKRAIASLEHYIELAPPGADTSEVRHTIDTIKSGTAPRE